MALLIFLLDSMVFPAVWKKCKKERKNKGGKRRKKEKTTV
jgi:hypothetical protein